MEVYTYRVELEPYNSSFPLLFVQQAVKNQKTAFLLEETKCDAFTIKVGHLKPGAEAKIVLTYVSELPVEEAAVRLTVPTTIAPRSVSIWIG